MAMSVAVHVCEHVRLRICGQKKQPFVYLFFLGNNHYPAALSGQRFIGLFFNFFCFERMSERTRLYNYNKEGFILSSTFLRTHVDMQNFTFSLVACESDIESCILCLDKSGYQSLGNRVDDEKYKLWLLRNSS